MSHALFRLVVALGVLGPAVLQPLSAQDLLTPQEKLDVAAVDRVVEDLMGAFKRADLDAMREFYEKDASAEYTKRNLEFFRETFKETKNLKAEFKVELRRAVSTTAIVRGEVRLSAQNKVTGREYFPNYPIPFYIGLDKGFGDSPWHVRVFLIEIDKAAIERRIRAFYDAFVKKDEEKVMATWTTKLTSNALAEKRATMRSMFSAAGPITLDSLEMEDPDIDGDNATVRVKVEVTADEVETGKPYLAGVMDLDWQMVREGADWKAIGFGLHEVSADDIPDF